MKIKIIMLVGFVFVLFFAGCGEEEEFGNSDISYDRSGKVITLKIKDSDNRVVEYYEKAPATNNLILKK